MLKSPYIHIYIYIYIKHNTIILTDSCNTRSRKLKHYQFTLHLFKEQPEDGPTIGPKHVAEL